MNKISVVVSVFNEEQSLNNFYSTTVAVLDSCGKAYELIFVNDGSTDKSLQLLEGFAGENSRVKVIDFSRNFGHEAAMIAGIDYATGQLIICMDADLQHPPESIPQIIEKAEDGYQVISMVRTRNNDTSFIKKITSKCFYKLLNLVSPVKFEENSSDFFAITDEVASVLRKDYREKVRYLRGYVQSIGFNKTTLTFEAGQRAGGESKYSIAKLISFSINALCSFSDLPLKLGMYSGFGVGALGVVLMIYSIINKLINGAPGGYTTIVVALCFLFAVNLCVIGVIGQYISILFQEIKGRPIYVVKNVLNSEKKD